MLIYIVKTFKIKYYLLLLLFFATLCYKESEMHPTDALVFRRYSFILAMTIPSLDSWMMGMKNPWGHKTPVEKNPSFPLYLTEKKWRQKIDSWSSA